MIKKGVCLFLCVAMSVPTVTVSASENESGIASTISLVDAAYVRNLDKNNIFDTALGGAMLVVDTRTADTSEYDRRMGFIKFDFGEYAEDADSIQEVKLSIASKDSKSSEGVINLNLSIMPDDMEEWDSSTLTYNLAKEMGMTSAESGELVYSGTTVDNQYIETDDIKEAVIAHLKENTSNSIVTFKVDGGENQAYQLYGMDSAYEPYISIQKSIDVNELLQEEYDALTFERINSSSPDAVNTNFDFVREGNYGTVIAWSSSDENIISSSTGIVTAPKKGEGDKKVILTAIISNGEYSMEKEFEVCVPEGDLLPLDMLRSETVLAYSTSFVRSGDRNKNDVYENQTIVVDHNPVAGQYRMGFVKFDFTGYEEILEQTQRVTLQLNTYTDVTVEGGSNFVVYVLPDSMEEGLDSSTLSYTEAEKRGLTEYTDDLVWVSPAGLKPATPYETADFYSSVKKNLDANPDNKVVWLKIASTEGAAYSIYGMNGNDMVKPQLILGYPKIPVELDTISLKLPALTKEDLKLPVKGEYGSDIEWYSYDESVISSDGKVNAGIADEDFAKEDKVVKLRATVTEGGETREKEIEVRAVRKGVMDPVKDTYINEEVNYADDETIVFGGNSGHYAFIDFDISSDKEYIQKSRKTVLKVYATKENAGEDIELSCITDSTKKNCDIDDISYDTAKQLAEAETKFKLASKINSDGYALFDVTEYVMGLTDERALFSLEASGKRVFLYSTDGSAIYAPKLISSDTEYSDEYGANRVAEELLFEDISSDKANNIRTDFTLPKEGVFGAKIVWSSSDNDAVDVNDGSINRGSANKNVTLTASITVGAVTVEKSFEVAIIKQETDAEYAAYLASTLQPDNTLLTSGIKLPGEELPAGAKVKWSSNCYEAEVDGFDVSIKRPSDKDLIVTLTATVTYNGSSASENYNVTLIRSADKNILRNRSITTGDVEAANAVDENIDTVWHIQNREVVYDMGSNKVVSALTVVPCVNSFSGIILSISKDNLTWENIYTGGEFIKDRLNYINMNAGGYGRYLKFEFPNSASDISFLSAYSSSDYQNEDVFASVTVPSRATSSFYIVTELDGNEISWKSSSSVIKIEDSEAIVKQGSKGTNVTLTANVVMDGVTYEKSYVVYVPASGSSGGGGGGGGGGGSAAGTATHFIPSTEVANPITPSATVELSDEFEDISNYAWAREYINKLERGNIISGKEEGKFYPQDNIKREEMAKILVLAFDIEAGPRNEEFSDVVQGSWYEEYVYTLVSSGGAKGMGNSMFGTGQNITRQDAFKMLTSVLGTNTAQYNKAQFNDSDAIADYASESVNALYAMGIISGDDNGCINPDSYITRAEAAKVICLAMEYAGN